MTPRRCPTLLVVLMMLAYLPLALAVPSGEGPALGRTGPDLTVAPGSYATNPDPPRVQDSVVVNVTVINQGDTAVGQFYVGFYLNDTSRLISRATVNSLAVGAGANVSCTWNTQTTETHAYATGMDYTIIVVADSGGAVAESDEGNNRFEKKQQLGPERLPDLELTGLWVDPLQAFVGDQVTAKVNFTNHGETTAKFFKVWCFAGSIQNAVSSVDIAALNVGEHGTATMIWDTAGTAPGTYDLIVHVNPEFYFTRIPEIGWSDNNASRQVEVQPLQTELRITSLVVLPAEPHRGDLLTLNTTVLNNGSVPADKVNVRLSLDEDELLNVTRDLAPGASASFEAQADSTPYPEGQHAVRAMAGPLSRAQSFTLLSFRRPDLLVRTASYLPAKPEAGDVLALTAEVANAGSADSPETDLSLYIDSDVLPASEGRILPMKPREAQNVTVTWRTSGTPAGDHSLRLLADRGHKVIEANESNNRYDLDVYLEGELDLSLSNLTVRPASPKVGDTVQFTAVVRNLGTLPCPSANLSLKVGGSEVGRKDTRYIAPGGQKDNFLEWPTAGVAEGNYSYELLVEPGPGTVEVDTRNNRLTGSLELLPPPPAPDLVVGRILLQSGSVVLGEEVHFTVHVENAGTADAEPCSLMVYLENATVSLRFTATAMPVPRLAPGGTAPVSISRGTSGFKAGKYLLNVTADSGGILPELNEANNFLTKEIELLPPAPKEPLLRVEDLRFEGKLSEGRDVNLVAVVANDGEGDALLVSVRFYIDGQLAGERTLNLIPPGTNATASLAWKAVAGKHGVRAVADIVNVSQAESPLREMSVAKKPEAKKSPGPTVVLAAAALLAAAEAVRRRRKPPGP